MESITCNNRLRTSSITLGTTAGSSSQDAAELLDALGAEAEEDGEPV